MIIDFKEKYNDDLQNIIDKAYKPYKSIYSIKPDLKKSNLEYKTIIYLENTKLIATLSYYFDNDIIRIFKVAVDPEYQGRGYFKKLLSYIEEKFYRYKSIALFTIKETGNYKYFVKCGFKQVSENIAHFVIPIDDNKVYEIEMIKNLE